MPWAFPRFASFRPVDPESVVYVTDIEGSTRRVAETGDYRAITFAATAGLVAAENRVGDLPGVFTGDGCLVLAAPQQDAAVGEALAALATWAQSNLGLGIRVARIPVARLKAPLLVADQPVGRSRTADDAAQGALQKEQGLGTRPVAPGRGRARQWHLLGGATVEADRLAKQGPDYRLPPAPRGEPDLTGLSCRWDPLRTTRGTLVAILLESRLADPQASHQALIAIFARLAAAAAPAEELWPVRPEALRFAWPPKGLALECAARVPRPGLRRHLVRLGLLAISAGAGLLIRGGVARGYVESLGRNAVAAQVIDGMVLIVDCTHDQHQVIRVLLEQERRLGTIFYGTAASEQAYMTCVVRSFAHHRHFLDATVGGHWRAAQELKRQRAESPGR